MSDYTNDNRQIATFGGGCFWCLDAAYRQLRGVTSVESGYAGGSMVRPTYHDVCSGTTGHAEVVRVEFDPDVVTYRDLLSVFFTIHDPTTLNRQGGDVGTQYRSVIFYHTPEQRAAAEELIAEFERQGVWDEPIVTELQPAGKFYPAESYHQDFYAKNPRQAYCQAIVAPKVAKVRREFMSKLVG